MEPSELAFGTARIGLRVSRDQALRVLERAWIGGVRCFDTAPSYGEGDSESALGDFVKRLGVDAPLIRITTKVGIAPVPARRSLLRVGYRVVDRVPALRRTSRAFVEAATRGVRLIALADFSASLDASLERLHLDQLESVLLHEASATSYPHDELMTVMAQLSGTCGSWGVSGEPARALPWLTARADSQSGLSGCGGPEVIQTRATAENLSTIAALGPQWKLRTFGVLAAARSEHGAGSRQNARSALEASPLVIGQRVLFSSNNESHVDEVLRGGVLLARP